MIPDKNLSERTTFSKQRQLFLLIVIPLSLIFSRTTHSQDLVIVPIFNNNITAAQKIVIEQVLGEWNAIIRSRGLITSSVLTIEFRNAGLTDGNVGNARIIVSHPSLIFVRIRFDNDGTTAWYVDPTPNNPFDDTIASNQFDFLTIARHEIGHAIGFISSRQEATNFVNSSETVFDQARLNIALNSINRRHSATVLHPSDIMNCCIGPQVRQTITLYPAAAFIARAYECLITMDFADSRTPSSSPDGSATDPWVKLEDWKADSQKQRNLLLIPGTYSVPKRFTIDFPVTISSARGGNAIISP